MKNQESQVKTRNKTINQSLDKIKFLKLLSIISGVILIISYYSINDTFDKRITAEVSQIPSSLNTTSNYYNPQNEHYIKSSLIRSKYDGYFLMFSIAVRAYSIVLSLALSKYNKGHYVFWGLLGLIFPYISLILAGLKLTSKNEFINKFPV